MNRLLTDVFYREELETEPRVDRSTGRRSQRLLSPPRDSEKPGCG